MAQQMEQNWVLMKVHVSDSTRNFISGMNFNVRERGSITIKTGKVVTFIVNS
jgi:hypothetical protein